MKRDFFFYYIPYSSKLYIEQHSDVSILYADVVNYTQITTQLPVRTLVETLHELFVKFDEASQVGILSSNGHFKLKVLSENILYLIQKEFNVLRIKFLGDCYYCVSGVPVKNKRHAKNCVDLGLRMIKDIRDVRTSRDLDIDMRIGVHSGTIISGVIGACKWQYDIWSKDVNIANRMESTGKPGCVGRAIRGIFNLTISYFCFYRKVHVTGQTLALLEEQYLYDEGTEKAKVDPVLKANNISTYLIAPQFFAENNVSEH
jgi:adenylate cyclase